MIPRQIMISGGVINNNYCLATGNRATSRMSFHPLVFDIDKLRSAC